MWSSVNWSQLSQKKKWWRNRHLQWLQKRKCMQTFVALYIHIKQRKTFISANEMKITKGNNKITNVVFQSKDWNFPVKVVPETAGNIWIKREIHMKFTANKLGTLSQFTVKKYLENRSKGALYNQSGFLSLQIISPCGSVSTVHFYC